MSPELGEQVNHPCSSCGIERPTNRTCPHCKDTYCKEHAEIHEDTRSPK